jgi:TrmH family RNA methyltransferase
MNRIAIVLHRPIYPRNVGMCARALANMGGTRLIIVGREEPLGDEAKQGAAHAQDVLRNAVFYSSLQDFYSAEGEGIRIALSGKDARLKVPDDLEMTVTSALRDSEHRLHNPADTIYLIFGTEDDGLSAEEMELCHYVCRLPTFSEVNSLNLSHAVLLATYIVRMALTRAAGESRADSYLQAEPNLEANSVADAQNASQLPSSVSSADVAQPPAVAYPQKLIHDWLGLLGFDLSSPRINIEKTLNRILLGRAPTAEELRIFSNVLNQTIRRLKKD